MDQYTITRTYTEKDREALSHVYLQTRKKIFGWLDTNTLALSDFDKDTKGESIWVCEGDTGVVGFIAAQAPDKYIHHLFVLPEFSGKGIGTRLLKTCLDEIGFPARLKCVSDNTRALAFYHSHGWKTLSRDEGIDGEYHLMEVEDQRVLYPL